MKADSEIIVHTTILPLHQHQGWEWPNANQLFPKANQSTDIRGVAEWGREWEGVSLSHEGGSPNEYFEISGANGTFSCILSILFSLLLEQWLHRF